MGVKLEPQPHGGALARSGRRPGSKNKPRPVRERVALAAGRKCAAAVKTLAAIMADPEAGNADRIRAALALLAYGVGRPAQGLTVDVSGQLPEGELRRRLGLTDD